MLSVLDQDTIDFVQEYLDSFVVWDLLVYADGLGDGQPLVASDLAATLGRELPEVEEGLGFLVSKRVFRRQEDKAEASYFYVAPDSLKSRIKKFVAALDWRDKRLAILTMLLGKGSSR